MVCLRSTPTFDSSALVTELDAVVVLCQLEFLLEEFPIAKDLHEQGVETSADTLACGIEAVTSCFLVAAEGLARVVAVGHGSTKKDFEGPNQRSV